MREIRNVAIIGTGALGLLYGSTILASKAASVRYIVDEERLERYRKMDHTVNGTSVSLDFQLFTDGTKADLVIVAVKYPGLFDAVEKIAPYVGEDTILLSVMNGISSEQILEERYGKEHLVYCVAQGMDAMKFESALTYTRVGELRIGITENGKKEHLDTLTAFLDRAGIAYTLEADILYRLWGKLMLNVGINQTCMVYNYTYGQVLDEESEAFRTFVGAMREVILVANAEGIALKEEDLLDYIRIIRTLSPNGMPSMAQDRINRKKSEVDAFAGTIAAKAEKHGLVVPVNRWLKKRVEEIENGYTKEGRRKNEIVTYGGTHLNPTEPLEEVFHHTDFAHALSMICRGNGQVQNFFSVAQHCIHASLEAEARGYSARICLACLLHDAAESYLSDVPRPFKNQLNGYREMEDRILNMIYKKYLGSVLTAKEEQIVREIDDALLYYDLRDLLRDPMEGPAPVLLHEYSTNTEAFCDVEQKYLELFDRYSQMI